MGYPESYNELAQWWDKQRLASDGDALIRTIEDRIVAESDPDRVDILNRFLAQEHAARGNNVAAEAVFRRDPAYGIQRWYEDLRRAAPDVDIIPVLQERIPRESDPRKLHALRFCLVEQHGLRHDRAGAEAVYLADIAANPDETLTLISLAGLKLYGEGKPEAALPIIDRAVAVAMRTGIFRRHALATKARVALELKDYAGVEDVMRQIMGLTMTRGHIDVGAERDILDRLPPGSIAADVAQAYDAYCRERGETRTTAQRSIDELVVWLAKPQWRKVARIILDFLKECERRSVETDASAVADGIQHMVNKGRLEAQGDLSKWRYSEVRLPAAPSDTQDDGSSAGGSAEHESTTIVASRTLTMEVDARDVEVPVSIYLPIDKHDHWSCDYEIGWPNRRRRGKANGIDAVQTLLIAMQMVGIELYTSEAHKTGRLKLDEPGGGYGFPLSYGVRDLYEGRDKQL
jgi:hypothetical protein